MEFILLALSFLLFSSGATSSSDPVLDIEGNELQRGRPYFAQSIFSMGGAGGLRLESPGKQSCPLYVVKAPFFDELGQPLMIFPENKEAETIREGHTLYIMFAVPTPCPQSTMWRFNNSNNVVAGGTSSSMVGPHSSRFALYRSGMGYIIKACPCSVGVDWPSCRAGCRGPLGVVGGKLSGALGVNDEPHRVVFTPVRKGGMESATRSEV